MILQSFGRFGTDGDGGIRFQTFDGQRFPIAVCDENSHAENLASDFNYPLCLPTEQTRTEVLESFADNFSALIDRLIIEKFGDEFSWDEHAGQTWRFSGDRPVTVSLKERYLLMILWDMREELNDVLHWLLDAKEQDIQEILDMNEPPPKIKFSLDRIFETNS